MLPSNSSCTERCGKNIVLAVSEQRKTVITSSIMCVRMHVLATNQL